MADICLAGQDELHQWAMGRRRQVDVGGEKYWVAPVEYVIIRKLEHYREGHSEKHLRDIAGMLNRVFWHSGRTHKDLNINYFSFFLTKPG